MVILYWIANYKSINILTIAIWDSTVKSNIIYYGNIPTLHKLELQSYFSPSYNVYMFFSIMISQQLDVDSLFSYIYNHRHYVFLTVDFSVS